MNKHLILIYDEDTDVWSIAVQTESKGDAATELHKLQRDGTKCLLITPSDYAAPFVA